MGDGNTRLTRRYWAEDPEYLARPAYIYILCFDEPRTVRDGDCGGQLSHYVGCTRQHRPTARAVQQHGAMVLDLVALEQGDELDEVYAELYRSCPRCGGSLWYFADSPAYADPAKREQLAARFERAYAASGRTDLVVPST